ncbi:MAG TPA: S1C family serine protease [Trueperaceae bacterium]|nr:S1C family serine protease [Trueperaceae bacterium]
MSGPRPFTWLLMFTLALTAVLATQLKREEPRLMHVQGPPPVEGPQGDLLDAYHSARDAAVRIEARCTEGRVGATLGVGTGFFVTSDGLVMTAYHVVDQNSSQPCASRLVAVTAAEEEFELDLVGYDIYMDVATLRADVDRLVPYLPAAAVSPRVGDQVVAIGNSRGDFLAPRAGRVTRLGVEAGRADFASGTIELTNSLAPGDSGGPVVNLSGEVIGVVSYISFNPSAMTSQDWVPPYLRGARLPSSYASYAVPLQRDSDLFQAVLDGERKDVPVIGFTWTPGLDYDPNEAPYYLGARPGPIVDRVQSGGPADLAGLKSMTQERLEGPDGSVRMVPKADVIVAVDGRATPTFYDLLAEVRIKEIGQTIVLTVQRGSATFRVELTLGARRDVFAGE